MKFYLIIFFLLLSFSVICCQDKQTDEHVYFGNEILIKDHLNLLEDKKIGIITNHTSLLPGNVYLVDSLISLGVNVVALFSPEHGIRGNVSAGTEIKSFVDDKTGLPVYSLYGKTKKPTAGMLTGVDLLLFDIQEIGARFYTINSTLYYAIEAAAEYEVPIIILDRPNPLNGELIAGPVLNSDYKSFIGIQMLPVIHGMTVGELALFFKDELDATGKHPKVQVIPLRGWNRKGNWNDLNREWIPTSPNIPSFETALVYTGTCFLEGTNISEGRGTDQPFLTFGAPFINSEELISQLELPGNSGIALKPVEFKPKEIKGKALRPKFEGMVCNGISIKVIDDKIFDPVSFGINVVYSLLKLYPENFKFIDNHFDLLAGTDKLRRDLLAGKSAEEIISAWKGEIEKFKIKRKKYLLY
jgi:uncharacterized protein YbbC (DUF1343 family)